MLPTDAFAAIEPLRQRMAIDTGLRKRLSKDERVDEFRDIGVLLQFMEHLGTLVVTGHISEGLVLAEYADNLDELWDRLGEMVYLRRQARVAFEHLAMRGRQFIKEGHMAQLYGRLKKDPQYAAFSN